jgi:hypothetical protein
MIFESTAAPLSLPFLILNLALGLGLSVILAVAYTWFGASLSNRAKFAPILPMLTLIIILLLTIVKFSPALTLGLFSAMSIVRYRTAVKDPEELVFLFFAVVIGLGLGTDQLRLTLVAFAGILFYMLIRALTHRKSHGSHKIFLNIPLENSETAALVFEQVQTRLEKDFHGFALRRQDSGGPQVQVSCDLRVRDEDALFQLMDSLRTTYPTCRVSVVQQNNQLGG